MFTGLAYDITADHLLELVLPHGRPTYCRVFGPDSVGRGIGLVSFQTPAECEGTIAGFHRRGSGISVTWADAGTLTHLLGQTRNPAPYRPPRDIHRDAALRERELALAAAYRGGYPSREPDYRRIDRLRDPGLIVDALAMLLRAPHREEIAPPPMAMPPPPPPPPAARAPPHPAPDPQEAARRVKPPRVLFEDEMSRDGGWRKYVMKIRNLARDAFPDSDTNAFDPTTVEWPGILAPKSRVLEFDVDEVSIPPSK
jgi:hypothetical protein